MPKYEVVCQATHTFEAIEAESKEAAEEAALSEFGAMRVSMCAEREASYCVKHAKGEDDMDAFKRAREDAA